MLVFLIRSEPIAIFIPFRSHARLVLWTLYPRPEAFYVAFDLDETLLN